MRVLNFDHRPFFIILLCLTANMAQAQGWINFYANADDQVVENIFQTADQGFAIVGYRSNSAPNSTNGAHSDGLFIKTDQFGNSQFEKTYGQSGFISEFIQSGIEVSTGGFLLVGEQYNSQNSSNTKYYIVKVNQDGDQEWVRTIDQMGADVPFVKVIELVSGNFILIGENGNLIKLDAGGDIILQQPSILDSSIVEADYKIIDLEILSEDEYISLISMPTGTGGLLSEYVTKFDSSGSYSAHVLIPDYIGSTSNDLVIDDDKSFIIVGEDDFGALIMKLDDNGTLDWHKTVYQANSNGYLACELVNIQRLGSNKYITTGICGTVPRRDFIAVLDSVGNTLFHKEITNDFTLANTPSIKLPFNEYVVAGNSVPDYTISLMKMDSLGNAFVNALTGDAIFDDNGDCALDTGEMNVGQVIIKATSAAHDFYTITDNDGNYFLPLDTGNYTVSLTYPNPYFDASSCDNDTFQVSFSGTYDTIQRDLYLYPAIYCPSMFVDISTPYLKRCNNSTYSVDYCNLGTATADNAYIEVEFDIWTNVLSSSIPYNVPVSGNTYVFDLGDVLVGDCGSIDIEVQISCGAQIAQTHCAEASIFPDTICLPNSSQWDSSSLRITADCINNDSVRFTIENIGIGDMDSIEQLVVIEEDIMVKDDLLQIPAGQSTTFMTEATGLTFRAIIKQRPGHPYANFATDFIEGCGGTWGPTNGGYVNMFPEADGSPFVSIDCQQNLVTTNSNTLSVIPKGATADNLIPANQALEYQVKFQNKGVDTANTVVIIDTLMDRLEMTSIVPGAASHPYIFEMLGRNMIKFTFENIQLPSHLQNERASHGYVKFKISQQKDLDKGSLISNSAAIFFDYNSPLETNEAINKIGNLVMIGNPSDTTQDSTDADSVISGINMLEDLKLNIYPNPFRNFATVEVVGKRFEHLNFKIYDMTGNYIDGYSAQNSSSIQLTNVNLKAGTYIFTLDTGEQLIGRGKITVY